MTARANVRIAPGAGTCAAQSRPRMRRVARFDLLAGAALSLIRAAGDALDGSAVLSPRGARELSRRA